MKIVELCSLHLKDFLDTLETYKWLTKKILEVMLLFYSMVLYNVV